MSTPTQRVDQKVLLIVLQKGDLFDHPQLTEAAYLASRLQEGLWVASAYDWAAHSLLAGGTDSYWDPTRPREQANLPLMKSDAFTFAEGVRCLYRRMEACYRFDPEAAFLRKRIMEESEVLHYKKATERKVFLGVRPQSARRLFADIDRAVLPALRLAWYRPGEAGAPDFSISGHSVGATAAAILQIMQDETLWSNLHSPFRVL